MTFALCHHPAHSPTIPMTVEAGVAVQSDGTLVFSFHCRYQPDEQSLIDIVLPTPTAPIECDNLWQHTCCEAFVSVPDAEDYLEFNFSPSACWAAYRFDAYRVRDEDFVSPLSPKIELKQHAQGFELTATMSPAVILSNWPNKKTWLIGLSAVIETTDHHKSYWAIRHDAPKPDFHRCTQFLLPLN